MEELQSRQAVKRLAVRDALEMPAWVLVASMMGFGSLARDADLSLLMALSATVGIWGLPGQVALAELYVGGTGAFAIVLAVSLANARFLPMALSLMPQMHTSRSSLPKRLLTVQLLSVNSWAAASRQFPRIDRELRRYYFVWFSMICLSSGVIGTALGYILIGAMPQPVALGMILLNPIFFAIVFASLSGRRTVTALLIGAVVGPVVHWVSEDWGVLITGLVGGTLAYWLTRGSDNA